MSVLRTTACLGLLLAAALPVAALATGAVGSAETVPCPDLISQTVSETEGTTIDCGRVVVPVAYDATDGEGIELRYGILRSTSLAPAPDPIIYLHGGPGGGELANMTTVLAERLATLRARRDIVVFDQRGSGYSPGEIECNDVFAAHRDDAFEAAPGIAEASGMNVGAAASEYLIPLCAAHLTERGVDLSQYNTVNNARDVASLVKALGFKRFNLYGHSYGTRLALEVLRQDPPGLRAVLLDSVLPTDVPWRERLPETNEEAFLGIYGMCLADPACAAAYPDLVATLNRVFARLADQPAVTKSGLPVTVDALEQLILFSANQAGGEWRVRYLPRLIRDLDEGDSEVFEALSMMRYAAAETPRPDAFTLADPGFNALRLLNRANGLAAQADALQETARSLASLAQSLAAEAEDTPAAEFLRALNRLEEGPFSTTFDDHYAIDRTALVIAPATSETLQSFINRHFAGIDAEILSSLLGALETPDVAEVFRRLRNEDRYANSLQELAFALRLFTCNDSLPFNSAEAARARISSYRIPGLTQREGRMMAYELSHCDGFPTGTLAPNFHDPVTGDGSIPVMVFTGTNDIQTATSWAEQAARQLAGSQFVRFPNTGHGATLFSQCARDVAAAFFDEPSSRVNADCKADLVPRFVLSDDALP